MKKIIVLFTLLSAIGGYSSVNADELLAPGPYKAGIWVDPDGCQHWVMDLGIEGMMSPVLNFDGSPQCGKSCIELNGDTLFDSGSAFLSTSARSQLDAVPEILAKYHIQSVSVIGHTDSIGSDAANKTLSEARAQAVAAHLESQNVKINNIVGKGSSDPIASNATDEGRAKNRRVSLTCN